MGERSAGRNPKIMKDRRRNAIIRNLSHVPQSPSHHSHRLVTHTIMAKDNANTERYIAIARACLKAINDTAGAAGSREQKIQAVYDAIDQAFQSELADYRQTLAIMATVLERIASGQLAAEQAAELARKTLDQQPESTRNARIH